MVVNENYPFLKKMCRVWSDFNNKKGHPTGCPFHKLTILTSSTSLTNSTILISPLKPNKSTMQNHRVV